MYETRIQRTTPIVKNLIILNVIVFIAQLAIGSTLPPNEIENRFALHYYESTLFRPYQFFTHMFMHSTEMYFHIIMNMWVLYSFGTILEKVWGSKKFLIFYLICGIAAALAQEGSWAYNFRNLDFTQMDSIPYQLAEYGSALGASGAIMGVVAAFATLFPNTPLMIFPLPIPIKAKWLVIGYVLVDLALGSYYGQSSYVAHFAHVGGAVAGFLLTKFWINKGKSFY